MLNKFTKINARYITQSAIKTTDSNKLVNQNAHKLISDSLLFVDVNYFSRKNKVFIDSYNQKITHSKDPHLSSSIKIYYSISFFDSVKEELFSLFLLII